MLAGSGLSLDAVGPKYKAKGGGKALASRSIAAPTRARASPSPGDDLAGWPASHLMNRFIVRAGWVGTLRFAHPTACVAVIVREGGRDAASMRPGHGAIQGRPKHNGIP
jgi:hypothetical protein